MAGPLLETKFHAPTRIGGLVPRAQLADRMLAATRGTLTLVSAPAGFGKSTLMAELVSATPHRVAWLSLDEGDDDAVTFWTYVFGALDRVVPGLSRSAAGALDGGSVQAAIASVINALASQGTEVLLVLDDLHVIEAPTIHQQLAWFLDHLPPTAHLVIGTRADPPMPLARLRARGALAEIRAAELRFTADEAAEYLNDVMGLRLEAADIRSLEERTEGWIAALQLAALSLRGRGDASSFIAAFAGDDRYVVDYLVEEVLRRQPADVRAFLLQTSILSRLTGPLVDAVTGRDDGRATLESLDRANLFLVPLDDQRRWYRYHHLFAGVLQSHLAAERPDAVKALHARAGGWFEEQDDFEEAIRHAFEAGELDRAADLLERAALVMGRYRREPTLCRLLDRLPAAVLDRRPVLLVEYAGALLSVDQPERAPALLERAEQLLGSTARSDSSQEIVVVDPTAFARLPAMLTLYQAAIAKLRGETDAHRAKARRVLDLVEDDDHLSRGGAESFLGLAAWEDGDLDDADRWYAAGMASLKKAGRIADLVGGAITTADLRLAQGRLGEALSVYERGLAGAMREGEPHLRGIADMHTGIGEVRYQRNDLAGAAASLAESLRLGGHLGFPRHAYRARLLEAGILQATGDVDASIRAFDEAERHYVADFQPNVRPVPAQRAAVEIAHGRVEAGTRWADERQLDLEQPVTYVAEYELLVLARLVVARARMGEVEHLPAARRLLDRLLHAAEAGRRKGSILEIRIVQSLAAHASHDETAALEALMAAVTIAEPEGYVRAFLDTGPAMTVLLRLAMKRSSAAYTDHLLRATAGERDRRVAQPSMVEPLSDRELEVLRLLRSELSGPQMANELVVSLNTLRTHTKNIYAKLGVTSRLAALRRAEELGLL